MLTSVRFLAGNVRNSVRMKFTQPLLDKLCFDRYSIRVVIYFGAREVARWTNKQTDKHPDNINCGFLNCELGVASCELRVASKLRVAS